MAGFGAEPQYKIVLHPYFHLIVSHFYPGFYRFFFTDSPTQSLRYGSISVSSF